MKNTLLTILILLTLTPRAKANCAKDEYLDLRNSLPQSFSRVDIKDQKSYGLCYAYAAATLVDLIRLKAPGAKGSNISPLEAALLGTITDASGSEEGGDVCAVVNALTSKGYACTDTSIPNEVQYKGIANEFHRIMVDHVFLNYLNQTEKFESVPLGNFAKRSKLSQGQKAYLGKFDTAYAKVLTLLKSKKISPETIPTALEAFAHAQSTHQNNTYHALGPSFTQMIISKVCSQSVIKIPKLKCNNLYGGPQTLTAEIDRQLELKQPVGISYCSVILTDNMGKGITGWGEIKKNCGPHASIIIGRKSDKLGRCHYLIRNSWGENFKYPWETSKGDIWISGNMLEWNVYGVHSVTN